MPLRSALGLLVVVLAACGSSAAKTSQFTVQISATDATTAPVGPALVTSGNTLAITVTPASEDTLSTSVGGNCPAGAWAGAVYTTGAITADCSVSFSASQVTYQVTASATDATFTPSSPETVAAGSTQAFTVTPSAGFTLSTTVGGTCPAGTWAGAVYTTGAITADCSVSFSASNATFQVTASATDATFTPSSPQTVASGSTQAFTVTPTTGFTLSTTVGGTCPAGTWAGAVYTTGAITADCSVAFSASQVTFQVTASATGATLTPSGPQTIAAGATAAFTVTANSGDLLSTTVGGTCPAGTWAGGVYTTGAITADCTVSFSAGPLTLSSATASPLLVPYQQTSPTDTFSATANGAPLAVTWSVDRTDIATITAGPATTAVLTPTGALGGLVTLTATGQGATATTTLQVTLTLSQNGATASETSQVATSVSQLKAGAGVGAVGGEGLGTAVASATTLAALASPQGDGAAQLLAFQYPYDATVWPLGLPAPLVMWTWNVGTADAIQIQLSDAASAFLYTGTFASPAILSQTGGNFIRQPIPQDVWDLVTTWAAKPLPNGKPDQLTLALTVASSGLGYGPISQTWTVASGALPGIIYFESYGQLVQNYTGALGGNGSFGGYIASLAPGDIDISVAAGTNTSVSGCRVCHSAAAGGSAFIAQHGDSYSTSSDYTLSPTGPTEHVMAHNATYPAVYPSGSTALTEGGLLLPLPSDTTPVTPSGLSVVSDLGTPVFSPDGTKIAFNPMAGTLTNTQALYLMDFVATTSTFSSPTLIADDSASPAATRPGWPTFLPDSQSVLFQQQSAASTDPGDSVDGQLPTRAGAKSQIYWTTAAGNAVALAQLNGAGYLPSLSSAAALSCMSDSTQVGTINPDHADDVDLNYQPAVSPVATGGYAWVAFESRRMYGSEITIPPFCSDPRGVDLITNLSPKKIWIAAVDLNAPAGTDPSHPAFYLPGQELLASEGRPSWPQAPCRADGNSCATGDQCCNGYCEGTGALVCASSSTAGCSQAQEKCTTAADCCDASNLCLGGYCTLPTPG